MNTRMIGILIRKDLDLLRLPVLVYFLVGALAVGVLGLPNEGSFYAGAVLLITALMGLSMHPAMATTVGERKEKTLAFVMSMPIKATDYTWAKLLVNLLMFFIPWAVLLGATVAMIAVRSAMPNGLIPFAAILFGAIAAGALAILCTAIVSESIPLTIATQIACNMLFQTVMYLAAHTASIKATMHGNAAVWNGEVLLFIGIEMALSALLFAATLWRQSRKTDFI